jgi:hypothetical protein
VCLSFFEAVNNKNIMSDEASFASTGTRVEEQPDLSFEW